MLASYLIISEKEQAGEVLWLIVLAIKLTGDSKISQANNRTEMLVQDV